MISRIQSLGNRRGTRVVPRLMKRRLPPTRNFSLAQVQPQPLIMKYANQFNNRSLYNVDEDADLSVGMLCLDSSYQRNVGDLEHSDTLGLPTHKVVVEGLSFDKCCDGALTERTLAQFEEAVRAFERRNVSVITGNCGFFVHYQHLIAEMTHLPVVMSSLVYLPLLATFYSSTEKIGLLTANGEMLSKGLQRTDLSDLFAFNLPQRVINQCQVIGMEKFDVGKEIACGKKVDYHSSQKQILEKLVEEDHKHDFKCFLLECTQLPQFADSIRFHFDKPVFDVVTLIESIVAGKKPSKRFGDYRRILPLG